MCGLASLLYYSSVNISICHSFTTTIRYPFSSLVSSLPPSFPPSFLPALLPSLPFFFPPSLPSSLPPSPDNGPEAEGLIIRENLPYLMQCPVTVSEMDLISPPLIAAAVWTWAPGYSREWVLGTVCVSMILFLSDYSSPTDWMRSF